MSYPWDILEIDAAEDKKTIKRAYAKKLKVCRPDESPEEFKQLRQAYDDALDMLTQEISAQAQSVETSIEPEAFAEGAISASIEESYLSEDEQKAQAEEQARHNTAVEEGQKLAAQLEQLMEDKKARNDLANWQFLFSHDLVFDLQYRDQISFFLFELFLTHQQQQADWQATEQAISIDVIEAAAQFFDWQNDSELQTYFGDDDYFKVIRHPKNAHWYSGKFEQVELANTFRRFAGAAIDWLLVTVFFVVFGALFFPLEDVQQQKVELVFLWAGMLFVYFAAFEFSSWRATLGKRLLKMKLFDDTGEPANYVGLAIRNLFRAASFSGIFYLNAIEAIPKMSIWLCLVIAIFLYTAASKVYSVRIRTAQ